MNKNEGAYINKVKNKTCFKNLFKISFLFSVVLMLLISVSSVNAAITSITVDDPNGGELWSGTRDITWTSDCVSGENINIFLGKDGIIGNPTSSSVVTLDVACLPKSFSWDTTGKVDATDYQIRIESTNFPTGIFDSSDDFFTIDNTDPSEATDVISTSHTTSTWSNDNTIVVTWTDATDATSGLDGYSILWDTTSDTLPDTTKDIEDGVLTTTSPALSDNNNNYFHIRSVDNAGNWDDTAVHLGPFFIDTTDPTTTDDYGAKDNVWQNADQTITLTPVDATSGVVSTNFCTGASCTPAMTYTGPVIITTEGTTIFRYASQDNAGNVQNTQEKIVKIDKTTPITIDDVPSAWQITSPLTITLTSTLDGFSPITTHHTIDGTDPTTSSSSGNTISITIDGEYTIKYFTIDEAGNQEVIKTASNTAKLDTTAPIASVGGAPSGLIVDVSGVTATIICDDGTSGCFEKGHKVSATDPITCSTNSADYTLEDSVLITDNSWVCAYAKDNAGNKDFSDPVEFNIFSTIQSAINAATDGDTINVNAGTYNEQVTINKNNLVIQSTAGAVTTIIDVTDKGTSNGGIIFNADGVTFDGFTIIDFTDSTNENKIIRINSDNNIIQNNIIRGNLNQVVTGHTEYGILFQSTASGNLIDSNEVFDIGNIGINIAGAAGGSENTISNNNVHDIGRFAITVDRAANSTITGNDISDLIGGTLNLFNDGDIAYPCDTSCWGIVVWGAGSAGTTIDQDLIGLPNGISLSSTQGVTIQNSEIANNQFIGIRFGALSWPTDDSNGNIIQDNFIHDNVDGIVIVDTGDGIVGVDNSINFNRIFDNVDNTAGVVINAENNWWGDLDPSDQVSTDVDFDPFAEDDTFTRFFAPELDSIGNKNVNEGSTLTITLGATDADAGETLTYSDNVEFGSLVDNEFTWTPTGANEGANSVTFTVSDGDLTDSETITITVDNVAPTNVDAGSDQTVNEGDVVSFSGSATDAGGDSLTYSWNFGDSGTSTDQNPTHTYVDEGTGTYTVVLTVDDGTDTTTDSTTITVNNVAPTITVASADKTSAVVDETITFSGDATDPSDDTLAYSWNFGDTGTSTDQNPTHSYSSGGIYIVTLTVNDGDGGTDTETLTVTVNDLIWELDSTWNLVSVPKILIENSKGTLLPGNDVFWYNASLNSWELATTIDPGVGYWADNNPSLSLGLDYEVDCTGPNCGPSEVITLYQGWNLLGHLCTSDQIVEEAFPSSIYNDLFVLRYDETGDAFQIYATQDIPSAEFTQMITGEGYWVFLPSGNLEYTNIC